MLQETFDLADDGELKYYLGTRFENNKQDGSITITQPQMVVIILELVGLNSVPEIFTMHDTPVCINNPLENGPDEKPRVHKCNYKAVVGCLLYFNSMDSLYITLATQKFARFCNSPLR